MLTDTSSPFGFTASHAGEPIDEQTIDVWELTAARRALALLKSELGNDGMLELLDAQRKRSDEYFARMHKESNGELRGAVNDFRVTGLTREEFVAWFRDHGTDHASLVAQHPEHYVIGGSYDEQGNLATMHVMELIAGHTPHIFLDIVAPDATEVFDQPLESDVIVLAGRGRLANGVEVARAFHQFTATADGFTARMCSMFPAALPDSAFQAHVEHHAIEWRNAIRMALAAKHASANPEHQR
ncbi:hypothetical protein F3087_44875 [Nocardia colli]|uniref:Uncharacterized protein n=1 Tax=Nocardia colli TaxID=2545717 RepID=A0A5N0DNP2_9NOCA|nr:hypothetical protein [Nocardia colli]KAA8877311.1 hypothetical protein F3087_44875 [Nocardia colli]